LKATGSGFVGCVIEIENPADERRVADQSGLSRYRFRVDENISGFDEKEVDAYSYEVRRIFKYFFIGNRTRVVEAAVYG
jgi:hypothetical protein